MYSNYVDDDNASQGQPVHRTDQRSSPATTLSFSAVSS